MKPAKHREPFWRYFAALVLICTIVDLYIIAGMDAQERKHRNYAEFVKQMAQMDEVSDTATKRAVKEYGR